MILISSHTSNVRGLNSVCVIVSVCLCMCDHACLFRCGVASLSSLEMVKQALL